MIENISWLQFSSNQLKSSKFEAHFILDMDFASVTLFCVTYMLDCILLESAKLNKTSPMSKIHSSYDHDIPEQGSLHQTSGINSIYNDIFKLKPN